MPVGKRKPSPVKEGECKKSRKDKTRDPDPDWVDHQGSTTVSMLEKLDEDTWEEENANRLEPRRRTSNLFRTLRSDSAPNRTLASGKNVVKLKSKYEPGAQEVVEEANDRLNEDEYLDLEEVDMAKLHAVEIVDLSQRLGHDRWRISEYFALLKNWFVNDPRYESEMQKRDVVILLDVFRRLCHSWEAQRDLAPIVFDIDALSSRASGKNNEKLEELEDLMHRNQPIMVFAYEILEQARDLREVGDTSALPDKLRDIAKAAWYRARRDEDLLLSEDDPWEEFVEFTDERITQGGEPGRLRAGTQESTLASVGGRSSQVPTPKGPLLSALSHGKVAKPKGEVEGRTPSSTSKDNFAGITGEDLPIRDVHDVDTTVGKYTIVTGEVIDMTGDDEAGTLLLGRSTMPTTATTMPKQAFSQLAPATQTSDQTSAPPSSGAAKNSGHTNTLCDKPGCKHCFRLVKNFHEPEEIRVSGGDLDFIQPAPADTVGKPTRRYKITWPQDAAPRLRRNLVIAVDDIGSFPRGNILVNFSCGPWIDGESTKIGQFVEGITS